MDDEGDEESLRRRDLDGESDAEYLRRWDIAQAVMGVIMAVGAVISVAAIGVSLLR